MPCLFANCELAAVNCPSEGMGLLGGDHATPHRTKTASNGIKGLLSGDEHGSVLAPTWRRRDSGR
jgi:hypothetical protein